MKSRSITKMNLTGGFFGGILGILSFWYIHPYVLPLGCFLGVVGGFFYQEIMQSAIKGWHKGIRMACEIWGKTVLLITTPTRKLQDININLDPLLKIIHFLIFLVVWPFRRPIIFYRWIKKHPMNQVYVLRFLAIVATIELTTLWMVPLGFNMFEIAEKSNAFSILVFFGIIVVITTLTYLAIRSEGMRNFYASWSAYSYQGAIPFFFREVILNVFFQVVMTALMSGIAFWFIAIGGAFLVIVISPLSFGIGMVKGIYRVAMKPGYGLCLMTTLAVTLISTLKMHTYFTDVRVLWIVALATGVVSAMAAEGLRQLIALFCEHSKFIQHVAMTELGTLLSPSGKFFWNTSKSLGNNCVQPIVDAFY